MSRARLPRFGIRAMIVGVAVAALGCAVLFVWLPLMVRRSRIDRILREIRWFEGLHEPASTFPTLRRTRLRDYDLLMSDRAAVLRRLLRTAGSDVRPDRDGERGHPDTAIRVLDEWLHEVDSVALARTGIDGLLELALGGKLTVDDESIAVYTVADLTGQLGLDDAQRARVCARTRSLLARSGKPRESLHAWVELIAVIGGREEIDLLIELLYSHDPDKVALVDASGFFFNTRSPDVVELLRSRLDDERTALTTLKLRVMIATGAGRRVLIAFAENPRHPAKLRRMAVHLLKRERGGLVLLLAACDDPERRKTVAAFFGGDRPQGNDISVYRVFPVLSSGIADYAVEAADPADPRPELRRLLDEHDRECRPSGYSLAYNLGLLEQCLQTKSPDTEAQRSTARRIVMRLRLLAPTASARTANEWIAVLDKQTSPVNWADWLSALEQTADDGDGLDVSDSCPSFSPDAVAILRRIAHARPAAYKAIPAQELLLKTEGIDEAGLLIDVMAEQIRAHPDKLSARDPELLRTLRRRFAVNFGWDIDAWRAWWKQERDRH